MPRTLHIVKHVDGDHPWDLIGATASPDGCTIVLIQNAVNARPPVSCETYVLANGDRPPTAAHLVIDDDRFVHLIWEADRVIVW